MFEPEGKPRLIAIEATSHMRPSGVQCLGYMM
jgi:hypothetical protein